MKGSLTGAVAS